MRDNPAMNGSLKGKLLLASPALRDPTFARSVLLIVEHGDDGAMGLVLNRPAAATVAEAAPELERLVPEHDPIYIGGPVQPGSVMVLAQPAEAGLLVTGDVGLLAAEDGLKQMQGATRRMRLFAGHAGWGPGQLEEELGREDWIVEPPLPGELFSDTAEQLWSDVLTRKGGTFALIARMPLDPSLN